MKLLRILRYIISAAFFGMIAYLLLDIVLWVTFGVGWFWWQWESVGPLAISDGYSIVVQTRSAHPFLAEYDQRLIVYGGNARNGKKKGTVPLHMNTGGRTYLEIDRAIDPNNNPLVLISDRYGTDVIQLSTLSQSQFAKTDMQIRNRQRIGIISGEAYPNKFIAPDALILNGTIPENHIEQSVPGYPPQGVGSPEP